MRRLPPLHILATFEAAARHKSFTKAAEELCVTKSAISHRIKLLERHFEAPFFMRQSRSMALTPQGAFFLEAVREALATLQTACSQMPGHERKVVRVSVRPAFASNWLIDKLGDFHRQHEDIDLEIYASKITNLRSVGADVAICYGRRNEWAGFECTKLLTGRLFPVCSPSYRQGLGKISHPKDLLRAVLLRLLRHPWKPWFKAAGVQCTEPTSGVLFSDAHLMLNAAVNGQGVALAFDILARNDLKTGKLMRLFDLNFPSDCAYYAIFPEDTPSKRETQLFLDWLVTTCQKESTDASGFQGR
jgi:LysR family transcriptional regulator, glycine cleavage system transcriptional activator